MPKQEFPSGRRLATNVAWNLLGTGAPLAVAIAAFPYLIDGLGTDRFGVLTLAWLVVGYFSLFDLGLGRALTKLVADKLGENSREEIPQLIWTALLLMGLLGLAGGLLAFSLTPLLAGRILNIPEGIAAESQAAFYVLSACIPIVIVTTGLRGILEAYQRFDLANIVRIPLGVATFLGPAAVLPFSQNLVPVVAALLVTRLAAMAAYGYFCLRVDSRLAGITSIDRRSIGAMLHLGGWMTVSNIVSPIMTNIDRFLIGSLISMTAVAYYATPYEVITKIGIVPGAVMGVIFPAFATAYTRSSVDARRLFARTSAFVFLAVLPFVLVAITFAREGLALWLGEDFARNSATVMQLLALGVLCNSLAQVPFGVLQAAGRPDITAKIHLVEFVVYVPLLWWFLGRYGIVGAASAWMLRVGCDALLLYWVARRIVSPLAEMSPAAMLTAAGVVAVLAIATLMPPGLETKVGFITLSAAGWIAAGWFLVLSEKERAALRNWIRRGLWQG